MDIKVGDIVRLKDSVKDNDCYNRLYIISDIVALKGTDLVVLCVDTDNTIEVSTSELNEYGGWWVGIDAVEKVEAKLNG